MLIDTSLPFGPGHERICHKCKLIIEPGQRTETIKCSVPGSEWVSGTYHEACSKPFASMVRAMNMLSRWHG